MEIEDLEKELGEQPQEVNETAVTEALKQAEEPQPEAAEPEAGEAEAGEAEENTVNLMQFGQIITNIYCGLSDYVYRRVKKTLSAPEWDPETKEAIEQSLTAFLSQYNVQMTPTTQLIVVLATVETMRYTLKSPSIKFIQSETENNEPADK